MSNEENIKKDSNEDDSQMSLFELNEDGKNTDNGKDVEKEDIADEVIQPSRRGVIIFGLSSIVAAVPLGLGAGYFMKTRTQTHTEKKKLSQLSQEQGPITPVNTKTKVFKGQALKDANVDQKSLIGGKNNKAEDAAVFIFSNGKDTEKKILDLYLDFDSQLSRDFILINQINLKNLVENGLIELRVHPVSSGSALSIYAPEAIAESFVTNPNKSWNLLISTMKLSAEIQANADLEILPSLVKKLEELEITKVNEKSIVNGTFSSWIIEVGNDPKLQTGYYPPIAYIDDNIIDPEKVDFNDVTSFQNYVLNQK